MATGRPSFVYPTKDCPHTPTAISPSTSCCPQGGVRRVSGPRTQVIYGSQSAFMCPLCDYTVQAKDNATKPNKKAKAHFS